jgi:MFS family permease
MTARTNRFVALRHHDYRLIWMGQFVSIIGSQMQMLAINWHIYQLLEGQSLSITIFGYTMALNPEALGLGGIGLARIVPIFFFALVGGVLADVRDRRKLLIWTNAIAGLIAACLALASLSGRDSVWLIYALTAAGSAVTAFSGPAYQSLLPNLVPREDLTNAISLGSLSRQVATIVGPALAGVVLSVGSVGWAYAFNTLSFAVIIGALFLLHYRGKPAASDTGLNWAAIVEGWRFVRHTRIIWSTMMLDFFATFFSSANTMLPLVAGQILNVGVQGYGVLSTAQAVGSLVAGGVLSLRRDIYRQGAVLLGSVAIYGLSTALFGFSTAFVLSYLLFALIGASDTVSTVIRQTIRQTMTPDRLRGRMTGINQIFFMGGPQLGELEAGLAAAFFGPVFAIVSGGVATIMLTGWIAWRYPRLRRYTSDTLSADQAQAEAAQAA